MRATTAANKAIEPTNWAATVGYSHEEPGSRLMHYGLGSNSDTSVNKTVVYANYLVRGNPVQVNYIYVL